MNTYYWIKLYYDLLDDYKVGNLPDSLKWRFIQCLLVAGEAGEDGFLPKTEEFAYRIRPITPEALNDDLSRMAKPGLVELRLHPDGDERWYVSKFSKRQEKISNAERQRSWRARKAAPQDDETGEETDLLQDDNGSITSRYVDKIRIDKDVYVAPGGAKHMHEVLSQPVQEFVTALSVICKTPYWPKTETEYHEAAYYLHGLDASREDILAFAEWWSINGYYQGKPALKTVLDEWTSFKGGLTALNRNGNGQPTHEIIEFAVFD